MKSSYIASLSTLAAAISASSIDNGLAERQSTCKLDTVANPNSDDVVRSIDHWLKDVDTVNNFLDVIGQITDPDLIMQETQTVFSFAADEPCQLKTLTNFVNQNAGASPPAAFTCASDDLANSFGTGVLNNLTDIINTPGNAAKVSADVTEINRFRCCSILRDLDVVWLDSATLAGVSGMVPSSAPREDACFAIDCGNLPQFTSGCDQKDNGSDGTP